MGKGLIEVFDVGSGQLITKIDAPSVALFGVIPEQKTLAYICEPRDSLMFADIETGQKLDRHPVSLGTGTVKCLAFTPNRELVVFGRDDGTVDAWNVGRWERDAKLGSHYGPVLAVTCSPTGDLAASGGADRSVSVWDLKTGKRLRALSGMSSPVVDLKFFPDASRLVFSCENGTAYLWNYGRTKAYGDFASRLARACERLGTDPVDGASLVTIGQWMAFRGEYSLAAEYLEKSGIHTSEVETALAQCYRAARLSNRPEGAWYPNVDHSGSADLFKDAAKPLAAPQPTKLR
jgi:WD40 repeat protein